MSLSRPLFPFCLGALVASACSNTPPPHPADAGGGGGIGAACAPSAACEGTLVCVTEFDGGYCSETCSGNSDCGDGGVCGTIQGQGGCLQGCSQDSDCRPSYVCDPTTMGCLPACGSDSDCAVGSQYCDNGGHCLNGCLQDTDCTTGQYCAGAGNGTAGGCQPGCSTDAECASSGQVCTNNQCQTATSTTPDSGIVDAGTTEDAGEPSDSGVITLMDAGGTAVDAGVHSRDAGEASKDAGEASKDAGETGKDAGEASKDAGTPADAGTPVDAGSASAGDAGSGTNPPYYCDSCMTDTDCGGTDNREGVSSNGNYCLPVDNNPNSPEGYCGTACTSTSDCPSGASCVGVGGANGTTLGHVCVPPDYACSTPDAGLDAGLDSGVEDGGSTSGSYCSICQTNADCASGAACLCDNPNGCAEGFCGATCTSMSDCTPGAACVYVSGVGHQCVPSAGSCGTTAGADAGPQDAGPQDAGAPDAGKADAGASGSGGYCSTCTATEPCATNAVCLVTSQTATTGFCGTTCTMSSDCASGATCEHVRGAGDLCVPTSGTCTTPADAGP